MARGMVYLIGAGPGNPKLITVRGLECLRRADVVLYDRLGTSRLLREVRPGAELIYVGKASGNHAMRQEEINRLLVRKAEEGKVVARLKGGDPFVFGRGGEEAEALAGRGIPFEVVPGVTSAVSAAAYAGIPVTHRTCASSLTLVTGHERPGKEQSAIDWSRLAGEKGTVVFLMGLTNLGGIVRNLVRHGRSPDTPVAVISSGTCPNQRAVAGTLVTIEEEVARSEITSPAIIVVGDVVRLREQISWFEHRPLCGQRIVVMRCWDQSPDLAEEIRQAGGETLEVVVAHGKAVVDPDLAARAACRLREADYVLFPSAGGAEGFFRSLDAAGLDARILAGPLVLALDAGAREGLVGRGIRPDVTAEDRDHLGQTIREHGPTAVALAGEEAVRAWVELLEERLPGAEEVAFLCADRNTAHMAEAFGIEGAVVGEPGCDAMIQHLIHGFQAHTAQAGVGRVLA